MPNDLRLRVVTSGDTSGLDKTARGLEHAADAADDFGDGMEGAGRKASHLDRQLAKTEASLKKLAQHYAETGDEAVRADIKRERSAYNELQRIEKILKASTPTGGGASGGPLGYGIGTFGLGAAAVAGGAPLVAGAAAGAAGLAGVGAGIASAINADPQRFAAEWESAISGVVGSWRNAATDFAEPLSTSIKLLGSAFDSVDVAGALEDASHFVVPLAAGAASFAASIGRGTVTLIGEAGPVIDDLASSMKQLGDDTEVAMEQLAEGAEGGGQALSDLADVFGLIEVGAGVTLGKFGELYDYITSHFPGVYEQWRDQHRGLLSVGNVLEESTNPAVESFTAAAEYAAKATQAWNRELDAAFGTAIGSVDALVGYERAVDALTEGFHRGRNALDASNESGRENIELASGMASAAWATREAAIAAGDGSVEATQKANQAYLASIGALEGILIKLGVAAAEARRFADQFRAIDGLVSTVTIKQIIKTVGATSAQGVVSGGTPRVAGSAYAIGVENAPPGYALVGEEGPEVIKFKGGESVYPSAESAAMLGGAGGWGGGAQRVQVEVVLNTDRVSHRYGSMDAMFSQWISKMALDGDLQITSRAIVPNGR